LHFGQILIFFRLFQVESRPTTSRVLRPKRPSSYVEEEDDDILEIPPPDDLKAEADDEGAEGGAYGEEETEEQVIFSLNFEFVNQFTDGLSFFPV
jgi:hypothetical protein